MSQSSGLGGQIWDGLRELAMKIATMHKKNDWLLLYWYKTGCHQGLAMATTAEQRDHCSIVPSISSTQIST